MSPPFRQAPTPGNLGNVVANFVSNFVTLIAGPSNRFVLLLVLAGSFLFPSSGFAATHDPSPASVPKIQAQSIGIEGRAVVALPSAEYQVKPLDDRTELILRIEEIERSAEGTRYHFYFIGLEPGAYLLADFLIRPDGSRPDEIGDTRLQVQAMLPEEHDGRLTHFAARPFPFIGGYRAALIGAAIVWIAGLAGFAIAGRKRTPPVAALTVPPPSFAERLRPLVEAATRGPLTLEQQASLERLLMGYWRDKLELKGGRMAQVLQQLKMHPEAGAILCAVERWLHQAGGGASSSEVNSLLEPYRTTLNATAIPKGPGTAMEVRV